MLFVLEANNSNSVIVHSQALTQKSFLWQPKKKHSRHRKRHDTNKSHHRKPTHTLNESLPCQPLSPIKVLSISSIKTTFEPSSLSIENHSRIHKKQSNFQTYEALHTNIG